MDATGAPSNPTQAAGRAPQKPAAPWHHPPRLNELAPPEPPLYPGFTVIRSSAAITTFIFRNDAAQG
ncbi:hypothetical protein LMG24076_01171 [Trinickia soli]|nr:hypothetical protein LMG24076_01171 [Trinickia soli]